MRHGSRTAYLVYTGLLAAAFLGMIAGPVKSNSALLLSSASISASSPIYSGTGPYAVTLSASAGGNPANLHVGNGDIVCADVVFGCGPLNVGFSANGFGPLTNSIVVSLTGFYTHLDAATISALYPSAYFNGLAISANSGVFASSSFSGHVSGVISGSISGFSGVSEFSTGLDVPFSLDHLDTSSLDIPLSGFFSSPGPGGLFATSLTIQGNLTLDSMPGGGDLRLANSLDVTFQNTAPAPEPASDAILPASVMLLFYLRRRARERMFRARDGGG